MNNHDGLHSPYGAFEMPDNTLGHIAHNGIGLPIDRTVLPEPIKSDASLLDRLAAFATWIGEFPFQQACVQGERVVNEAIAEIERLRGEIADGDASELTSLREENGRLRKALETEQTMHAAWRKRAEEAETATPRGVLSICPNAKPVDPSQLTEFQSQREEDIKEHIRLARQAVAGGGEKDLRLCYPFSVDTCSNPKCPCRSELAAAAEMPSPDKETQCSPA